MFDRACGRAETEIRFRVFLTLLRAHHVVYRLLKMTREGLLVSYLLAKGTSIATLALRAAEPLDHAALAQISLLDLSAGETSAGEAFQTNLGGPLPSLV